MLVLPQRADEEGVWRIFEVFTKKVGREINTGNLHFYLAKTEQAVCPFKYQSAFCLHLSQVQHSRGKPFGTAHFCIQTRECRC